MKFRQANYLPPHAAAPLCMALAIFAGGCCCCLDIPDFPNGPPYAGSDYEESEYVVTATDQNFDEVVLAAEQPVLVDFWAPWCGPCMYLKPAISELADEYHGRVIVAQLNVDENNKMASRYRANAIPLLLLFHNGDVIAKQTGVPDDGSDNVVTATRNWLKKNLPAT